MHSLAHPAIIVASGQAVPLTHPGMTAAKAQAASPWFEHSWPVEGLVRIWLYAERVVAMVVVGVIVVGGGVGTSVKGGDVVTPLRLLHVSKAGWLLKPHSWVLLL